MRVIAPSACAFAMQRSGVQPPAVHQIIGSLAATDISEASANPAPFAFLRPRRGCALALGKSEGMAWLCASVRTQAGAFHWSAGAHIHRRSLFQPCLAAENMEQVSSGPLPFALRDARSGPDARGLCAHRAGRHYLAHLDLHRHRHDAAPPRRRSCRCLAPQSRL